MIPDLQLCVLCIWSSCLDMTKVTINTKARNFVLLQSESQFPAK